VKRSDIWWRIPEIKQGSRVLDLGAGGPAIPNKIDTRSVTYLTSDLRRFREADLAGHHHATKLIRDVEEKGPYDIVLYEPPQREAKQRIFELIDGAFKSLGVGGRLYLAARKDRGASSYRDRISVVFGNVALVGRAKRMRVFEAHKTGTEPGEPSVNPWTSFELTLPGGRSLPFKARAGVFSADEFDPGSRFLVETIDSLVSGRILDFGCGAGTIGISLAANHPQVELTMVDVNALATQCAQENTCKNGLESRATVLTVDGYDTLAGQTFDWIASNPPFHEGNAVAHPLIEGAPGHLEPGGKLALVVMRVEPYVKAIERVFRHFKVLATDDHYTVVLAEEPWGTA